VSRRRFGKRLAAEVPAAQQVKAFGDRQGFLR
jgi:hypothetical protein